MLVSHIHDVVHPLGAGRVADGNRTEEGRLEASLSLAIPSLDGVLLVLNQSSQGRSHALAGPVISTVL